MAGRRRPGRRSVFIKHANQKISRRLALDLLRPRRVVLERKCPERWAHGTELWYGRPWAEIHLLVSNQECSVDLSYVKPGERSSLHSNQERHELFHFMDDGAYLEVDGGIYRPQAHHEFMLEPGTKHRFWATESDFPWWLSPSEPGPPRTRSDTRTTAEEDLGRTDINRLDEIVEADRDKYAAGAHGV